MTAVAPDVPELLADAAARQVAGDVRGAIELLTGANRSRRDAQLEQALVALRRADVQDAPPPPSPRSPVVAVPNPDGEIVEVERAELTVDDLRAGLARSGCLLVRGLIDRSVAEALAAGVDAVLAAYDQLASGSRADPEWYDPGAMPDRVSGGLSEEVNRRFLRERGGVWTVDSPRMLFELFEVVEASGFGRLMTEFLGERPVLSANKCTLRRVPPELVVDNGWHQDGAFLGEEVGALNLWLALSDCGRDAPGLDVLPKRVPQVLDSDAASKFDWSLSHSRVHEAAGGTPIARPEFAAGDALLFDQLLVHQTGTSPAMTRPRYAIEAWFFTPSAYPEGQVPVLY
jgi:hypothetical protein